MGFSTGDVVPFTQARANLSELADQVKAGAEKIITKNGESYVALIDAERQRPAPCQDILQPGAQLAPPWAQRVVERRHIHAPGVVDAVMVLHTGADIGIVLHHGNSQRLQMGRRFRWP